MKKKDKVTLKGVDKPEVFQHWTEDQVLSTANSCKEFLGDIDYATLTQASYDGKAVHCKYDELTGKILYTVVDPYHIEPIDNPQKPPIVSVMHGRSALLDASVEITLQEIKRDHPEVLKRFIEKHYGK